MILLLYVTLVIDVGSTCALYTKADDILEVNIVLFFIFVEIIAYLLFFLTLSI